MEKELADVLAPLSRDALLGLLIDVASSNREVHARVVEVAEEDVSHRKLFIRGLHFETTDEELHAAFEVFGSVEEAAVIKERGTGRNKGYGFVTYNAAKSAVAALEKPLKLIHGREATAQLASQGDKHQNSSAGSSSSGSEQRKSTQPVSARGGVANDLASRKLFIRNLSWSTNSEGLVAAFGAYGRIIEGAVMYEGSGDSRKSKGFGFVTYESITGASLALSQPAIVIDGRTVIAQLAAAGKRQQNGGSAAGGSGSGPHGAQVVGGIAHGVQMGGMAMPSKHYHAVAASGAVHHGPRGMVGAIPISAAHAAHMQHPGMHTGMVIGMPHDSPRGAMAGPSLGGSTVGVGMSPSLTGPLSGGMAMPTGVGSPYAAVTGGMGVTMPIAGHMPVGVSAGYNDVAAAMHSAGVATVPMASTTAPMVGWTSAGAPVGGAVPAPRAAPTAGLAHLREAPAAGVAPDAHHAEAPDFSESAGFDVAAGVFEAGTTPFQHSIWGTTQ